MATADDEIVHRGMQLCVGTIIDEMKIFRALHVPAPVIRQGLVELSEWLDNEIANIGGPAQEQETQWLRLKRTINGTIREWRSLTSSVRSTTRKR